MGEPRTMENTMSYEQFVDEVRQATTRAMAKLGYAEKVVLEVPPKPTMGDLATTVTFAISKKKRKDPTQVAKEIASCISIVEPSLIEHVETAGPYLNFFMKVDKIAAEVFRAIEEKGTSYGGVNLGRGKRVLIEHTNVNPNKAIHIGHARNTCLGDSLARILRFTGHDVQVANYVDDSGTQVADIILGFLSLGFKMDPPEGVKFDQYCGDHVYVKVNQMYEAHPELLEQRKRISKQIEEGNNDTARTAKEICLKVMRAQLETCWKMNVYFDLLNWETDILRSGLWHEAFAKLRETGLVVYEGKGKLAGCWIAKVTELPEFAAETDAVLVRSNGTTTYLGKDIPYGMWKLGLVEKDFSYEILLTQPNGKELWTTTSREGVRDHPKFGFADTAISVVDVRQSRPQEILTTMLRLVAGEATLKKYIHYAYEVVSLSPKTARDLGATVSEDEEQRKMLHMEGRRGLFVNADRVLESLMEKALAETLKRNPGADESWLRETAWKIAAAALRYNLTKVDNDKIIVFDLDEALDLEGETGPYIQYAHVRACRILEKAGIATPVRAAEPSLLTQPEEITLIKELSKFPYIVRIASESLAPQQIARYSYNLATVFNAFYERCRVIGAEPRSLEEARIRLVHCSRIVLKNSLALLGIDTPDRM